MKAVNAQEEKTKQALSIVERAIETTGYNRYRNLRNNDHAVQSLIPEFKSNHVFTTKRYRDCLTLYKYKNGGMNLWQLKQESHRIFIEQMKDCGNERVDYFWGIKREKGK